MVTIATSVALLAAAAFAWQFLSSTEGFMPHGHCYLWNSNILWLHIASDAVIAISYYSIPIFLWIFVKKRTDLAYHWIFLCFACFILACGTTHLMEIWVIWKPQYYLSGVIKAITAVISLATAILLVRILPATLRLPSPAQLRTLNAELTDRIRDHEEAEQRINELNRTLEARVAKRTQHLNGIIEAIPDPLYLINANGELEYQNSAAHSFRVAIDCQSDLPPAVSKEVEKVLTSGDNSIPQGFRDVHQYRIAGRPNFRLCRVVATSDEQATHGVVALLQDVTDFHLLDEIKSDLIGTVSHELRTPVTSIQTSLSLLKKRMTSLGEEEQELLGIAQLETDRITSTLRSLLDMTRLQRGLHDLEETDVPCEELLQEAITSVSNLAKRSHIQVNVHNEVPHASIRVDRAKIVHVLVNLLTNSLRHSAARSSVDTGARSAVDGICFYVRDQGPGIDPEFHAQVFERFFRLPNQKTTGVGLGLSIVKQFVEAHDGQLELISPVSDGKGTEVRFVLPAE